MSITRAANLLVGLALVVTLAACGGGNRMGGMFGGFGSERNRELARQTNEQLVREERIATTGSSESIWDLFARGQPETAVRVNRYLWTASLEVLDFLPVESIDPFTGVITTGFGTPPGGGRPYRATIHVSDTALDARSLNVALITRAGPASTETVRAVEDAILARARQLRIRDRRL